MLPTILPSIIVTTALMHTTIGGPECDAHPFPHWTGTSKPENLKAIPAPPSCAERAQFGVDSHQFAARAIIDDV
jgi:hypothetical protein